MAKWSSESGTGFLRALENVPVRLPGNLPQAGQVFEKTQMDAGLAEKIKEAAARAKAPAGAKTTGDRLQVDELAGLGRTLTVAQGRGIEEDRLEKARTKITEAKFEEALGILAKVLEERADHPVALYLKGLCEFRLNRAESALRTIAPLVRSRPTMLDSQMRQLRIDIRESMTPAVAAEVLDSYMQGNVDAGLQRIQGLLELDPEVPAYHLIRAHVLLAEDRLDHADAAIETATPYCQGSDREILETMRHEVASRRLRSALEPARGHYRAMKWRKARKELEHIRVQWGYQSLWQVFHNYLEALGGGLFSKGRRPVEVIPQGDPDTVEQFHFLVIREELDQGKRLMAEAQPSEARSALLAANELTPHFPYLHYLIGQATHLAALDGCAPDHAMDLEEIEAMLQQALEFAQSGARDPEILAAAELVDAVRAAQHAISAVRAEQQKQEKDLDHLRPLGERFVAVMQSANDGIQTVEQFHSVRKQLRSISDSIPKTKRGLVTEMGRAALDQLGEAVMANLSQLEKLEPDIKAAEKIGSFQQRLHDIATKGPAGARGLAGVDASLRELDSEVASYRQSGRPPDDARKALSDLTAAIDRLRRDVAEAGKVQSFLEHFNSAFQPLLGRRTPLTPHEALTLKREMANIVSEGGRLLPTLSGEAREKVREMVDTAREVVSKIH